MTCRYCPEPAVTKTRCATHATAHRAAARAARLVQAKRGRCTECPKSPVFGRAYCQAHLDAKRDMMRRRRGDRLTKHAQHPAPAKRPHAARCTACGESGHYALCCPENKARPVCRCGLSLPCNDCPTIAERGLGGPGW